MNVRAILSSAALVAIATAAQCPPQDPAAADSTSIARLETEARALAKTDGCTSADQCRAAPVGARPCGGPRTYVVYCARTTDSAALYRKLDELRAAERAYNAKRGLVGTCDYRMPPGVGLSGGQCAAVAP